MEKRPISVFIIAKNEADRIATTIRSVKEWADEVIVIDSGSTDQTMTVSETEGARVLFHSWQGYGLQKRYGEDNCKNDWLLNLDADEEITPELSAEILRLFENNTPSAAAYILPVRDLLPGEEKLAPFAHTNHCIRLYNKQKARFSTSPVHDSVIVTSDETIEKLTHPVLHRSFRSLAHAIKKMNDYTSAQAAHLQKKGLKFAYLRLAVEFPFAFFKGYILRGYALRGARGFTYSMLYAFSRVVRIAKYLER